jgi:hypothetical protein
MLEKAYPKKSRLKKLIPLLSLFIFLTLFLVLLIKLDRDSTISLNSFENKFKVNFNIEKSDQKAFEQVLTALNLPTITKEGFEFELDSTTSAKLAFSLPAQAEIDFEGKEIEFEGEAKTPFLQTHVMEDIRLPKDTQLAIFAGNLVDFASAKSQADESLSSWLRENSSEGQYFAVFSHEPSYVFVAKSKNADFEKLKQISKQDNYKQQEAEGTTYHLLKVGKQSGQTIALFERTPYLFLVSSLNTAKAVSASLNSKDSYNFKAPQEPVNIFLSYQNKGYAKELLKFLFEDERLENSLSKIEKIEFILKPIKFSGLIITK